MLVPLCQVSRLQFPPWSTTRRRGEVLPRPSHCAHRETTLALTKPRPSRSSAQTRCLQLSQPTWTFPFNGTEKQGQPKATDIVSHLPRTHFFL